MNYQEQLQSAEWKSKRLVIDCGYSLFKLGICRKDGKTTALNVPIGGSELNDIIAKAKMETYAKYPKQVSGKAILKTEI